MKTLGDIIKNYREENNLSMDDFSNRSGISKTYIAMLEKNYNPSTGKEITPSLMIYHKAAKAMYLTLDNLLKLLPNANILLSAVENIENTPDLSNISNIIPLDKARKIPILGQIACGFPIWAEENLEGYFIADSTIKADFALKCKGDSMIDAEIYDGDLVFLKKTPDVENGKIAAVLINNEATLKKVIKTNDVIILQPCNSNSDLYNPILLDGKEDTIILGEMVGVYHPYKK